MIRVIIDPKLIASVLIGGISRERFALLTEKQNILEFIYCDELIKEILALAKKTYFQRKGIELTL